MGKNDANNTNRGLLDRERGTVNSQYNSFLGGIKPAQTRQNSEGLRTQIRDTYSNPDAMMAPGMTPNSSGWFNIPGSEGGGGSAAGGDFSSAKKGYQNFADTGGAEDFADAKAGYGDFAKTGGIGESDRNAMRARTQDTLGGFYKNYKNSAQRRSNVQGGYSPGFDAQQGEMARQAGREGFRASQQTEADIMDRVQQGRQFGVSGQAGIGSQISGNRLAGMGGLTNIGGMEQQNNQFNAGLGEQRAGRIQSGQLQAAGMYQQNRQNSAGGLGQLYGQAPGDVSMDYNAYLQGMGGRAGNVGNNLGVRGGIKDYNFMRETLPGLVGAAGGAAAGYYGAQ